MKKSIITMQKSITAMVTIMMFFAMSTSSFATTKPNAHKPRTEMGRPAPGKGGPAVAPKTYNNCNCKTCKEIRKHDKAMKKAMKKNCQCHICKHKHQMMKQHHNHNHMMHR